MPVVAAETIGWPGDNDSERARRREVKLGCLFTQSQCDEGDRPVREKASTSYAGVLEGAEEFGRRIWQQAWERSWSRPRRSS